MILLGSFILATTLYHIHFQNHLVEGGFIGIALILKNLFGISPSISTILMDIPIILAAAKLLGMRMVVNTFIGAASFSVFYSLMENYSPFTIDLTNYLWAAAILGGVLAGIGLGLILRFGGATGGDDIISILLSKYTKLTIGQVFFVFDAVIIALSLYYLTWTEVAFTILAIAICSKVMDYMYYSSEEKETEATVVSLPKTKQQQHVAS
ncbi:YitT family protein [Priestia taiwanensis]